MVNILYQNKTELKVFFVIWLCLFFIFSPISMGLYLTPKIEKQEAQAWLANIIFDAASDIWKGIMWVWDKAQDWAIAAWNWVKANISDMIKKALVVALQIALHQVLAMVTNSIIKWIQSDFQGQPGFITDWKDYLEKAGDAAAGRFLNELAGVNLCSSFSANLKVSLALPVPTFSTAAACTLEDIMSNVGATIDDFYEDFQTGGWLAFEESRKPQNSAFGAYLMAMNTKSALQYAEIQKVAKESKSGFKSTKKCQSTSKVTTTYSCGTNPAYQLNTTNNTCYSYPGEAIPALAIDTPVDASTLDPNGADCSSAVTTAPDGTVEFTTNLAATSTFRGIEAQVAKLAGESGSTFAPYVTAIANALITQLVKDGVSGLTGMVSDAVVEDDGSVTSTDASGNTTTTTSTITISADDYESIMNDYAILGDTESGLNQIDTSGSSSTTQSLLSTYQSLASTTMAIKDKQLATIIDQWSRGAWENADNDANGTETVDDDATTTSNITSISTTVVYYVPLTHTTTTIITDPTNLTTANSCDSATSICTFSVTIPSGIDITTIPSPMLCDTVSRVCTVETTSASKYIQTTTITTTEYAITFSKDGEASIGKATVTETKTEIVDSRSTDLTNYDASGNQITDYDSTTYSYSLNAFPDPADGAYKCASDYSSSGITCQIDIDPNGFDYQSKVDALSNISSTVSQAIAAVSDFENYAEIYDTEFSADSTSSATATALANATTARDYLISVLQAVTGSSNTTLEDLNDDLMDTINGYSSSLTTSGNITITDSSGLQTTETASTYFQDYYNDLITIYNSLLGVTP